MSNTGAAAGVLISMVTLMSGLWVCLPISIIKLTSGSKITVSVPYGYLIGKVGSGNVINIGNMGGPFTADASGFLSLRMNDGDKTLGDNDGAITVAVRATV